MGLLSMAKKIEPEPGKISLRVDGEVLTLRLSGFLLAAIEIERERQRRTLSDMVRIVLEDAFDTGPGLLARIGKVAARDRRDRLDVIRLALEDRFEPRKHGKPLYPSKRPSIRWI